MKIMVVSDTHGFIDNFRLAKRKEGKVDVVVHCGDIEGDEGELQEIADCPVYMVGGNNDFFSGLPRELEFTLGGRKVFLTHGHQYYVSTSGQVITREAMERGATIVMYGHTHRPVVEQQKNVLVLNPGSLTYPRQNGRKPSYIMLIIEEDKTARATIRYLFED